MILIRRKKVCPECGGQITWGKVADVRAVLPEVKSDAYCTQYTCTKCGHRGTAIKHQHEWERMGCTSGPYIRPGRLSDCDDPWFGPDGEYDGPTPEDVS